MDHALRGGTASPLRCLEVRERIARRAAVAILWLGVFGALAYSAYRDADPAAGPIGFFAALAGIRLAWLAWWRFARGVVLSIAHDGLWVRGLGRFAWEDLVGIVVREERIKWKRMAFLDLCIRRPSRYDLAASRRAPGRDGFAVRYVQITWIDVDLEDLRAALRDARGRIAAPFADSWALDMTGPEIRAELDADEVLGVLQRATPALRSGSVLPDEVEVALARAPQVVRERVRAASLRTERQRRTGVVLTLVIVILTGLSVLASLV